MERLDRFYGCLIGGAAGDALGYAVEFDSEEQIALTYGEEGITAYELTQGAAIVSDDTQMTFFTANGLLLAAEHPESPDFAACISQAYQEWYRTQTEFCTPDVKGSCWLLQEPRLFVRRAPGGTCMTYAAKGAKGSVDHPENDRCGCGGVMRAAPIGLFFDSAYYRQDWIDMLGAEAAAMTHGHPYGYIPAAALVHLISRVTYADTTLREAAKDTVDAMQRLFPMDKVLPFVAMMQAAITMSASDAAPLDCMHRLGEGWTGHEAFAIALYCALKYEDDFDMAIRTAVNHKGDSDSTGAITGNILGAYLGLSGIPEKYTQHLEMIEVARTLAEQMHRAGKALLT